MILAVVAILAQLTATQQRAREIVARDAPAIVTRARLDTSALVNFRVLVQPETVYVGQQANYQLGVFLDETVRDRMRSMEALAPEMRSMMAYEPPAPLAGFPLRNASGHRYEAHVYQRPIFPLSAGRVAIPPARLLYAMPLSYSFFSREESFELRSDSAVVVALDPPLAGRPADWTGAVGTLRLSTGVDSAAARVGDAMRLVVRVSGQGNVKLFPRPALALTWASTTAEGERVTMSADSMHIGGTKEFDWVITPRVAGRVEVPPVRYPYFDPYARQYEVAESAPVAIFIAAGTLASADTSTASSAPRWMLRPTYRGALPPPLYRSRALLLALLLIPVPVLLLVGTRRPSRRKARIVSPAVSLRALAREESTVREARSVRRTFLNAVADRLSASATEIAEPAALHHLALRAGVTVETADRARVFISELNSAAFDVAGEWAGDGVKRAYELYRAIDREARARRGAARADGGRGCAPVAFARRGRARSRRRTRALCARRRRVCARTVLQRDERLRGPCRARAARAGCVGEHGHRRVRRRRHRARDGRVATRAPPRAARGRRARSPRSHLAHRTRVAGLRPCRTATPARRAGSAAVDGRVALSRLAVTQAGCDGATAAAHGTRRRHRRGALLCERHGAARSAHQCLRSGRRRA